MRPTFVDAHLHLWDRARLRYPWLKGEDKAAIASTYLIADYREETAAWNVAAAVHVEAGAHAGDAEAETDWLNAAADQEGLLAGLVVQVALNDPDIEGVLERQAARPRVKGVRHLINWHSDPARQVYPADLTLDPAWRRGFAALARHGLSYDFHGFPPQLAGLAEVAAAHPDVQVVVNHLGMPIRTDGLEQWRAGIRALAAMPQVSIKLSGAGFVHSPFDPLTFGDLMYELVEAFGCRRAMVASNFPTDRLFASLDCTLRAYEALFSGFSGEDRADLWGRNANRIYRLDLKL
ncbi:amidohydrolase family protein [Sphingobium sp. Sx8-8]|uniref:amidohydrolase family protein n=1 Tax=Sphingobium sp. Sx8-8 TaxID=2933617 RepID=UPI001F5A1811|nr:amidohydrolase family protein [Sphingobium sp. Sx8-8]